MNSIHGPRVLGRKNSDAVLLWIHPSELSFFFFFLRFYVFILREKGREKERERNISVWSPLAHPLLETWLTTQACVLTGNQTRDPLVHRLTLNPLSHIGQGLWAFDLKESRGQKRPIMQRRLSAIFFSIFVCICVDMCTYDAGNYQSVLVSLSLTLLLMHISLCPFPSLSLS